MLLAAIGLYGVVDYSVRLRVSEIGIRMALGAGASSVQRLFLRRGLELITVAMMIGLPAAFLMARLFSSILYGIKPDDAVTFISIPIFLACVALVATYIPARRATKVDPMVALRYE
jgi:ABC-type antimicrobial peptide transport system permease subunit